MQDMEIFADRDIVAVQIDIQISETEQIVVIADRRI